MSSTITKRRLSLIIVAHHRSPKLLARHQQHFVKITNDGKENVSKKLEDLEGVYRILHAENYKVLEKEKSLKNEILGLRKDKHELEDGNIDMFGETIFQSQLSFVYKDIVFENLQELRNFVVCMDNLRFTNKDLEERVKLMEEKLRDEQTKNLAH
uniref:Uncharacterized protein n=1 Tax=Cucumis melo TaxID=3656 RepID=A0A9I9EDT7_CUCME